MDKKLVLTLVGISLVVYFSSSLFIFPDFYLSKKQTSPRPFFSASVETYQIQLGDSFSFDVFTKNIGEYADIHILSVGFPNLKSLEPVKIVNYNFSHSPDNIVIGEEIGAEYSGGLKKIQAKYPIIEAFSRPVPTNSSYYMKLIVTPETTGTFSIYVKSVGIPHTTEDSHYPQQGFLDAQGEYVEIYEIMVNP